jgi:signal peptidase II
VGRVLLAVLFLVLLGLDQATKYIAEQTLTKGVPVPVIPNLFNFTLVYNPGAAFGLFGGLPDTMRRVVLLGVSIAAFAVVLFMYRDAKGDKVSVVALVAIVSGAVGNLIDRIRYDAVVDFLDFYWGSYHWPAFNIADSAICVGVAVLVLRMLFVGHPSESAERPELSSSAQIANKSQ